MPQLALSENEKLKNALEAARGKLLEQDTLLRKLNDQPHMIGAVLDIRDNRMTVMAGGQYDMPLLVGASIGDKVLLLPETLGALKVLRSTPTGLVATVSSVKGDIVEIALNGNAHAVRSSIKVQEGERVIVDAGLNAVLGSMGMPRTEFEYDPALDTTWDDIGGQDEAKAALREAIELPYQYKDLFKKYGKKPSKGVLLFGGPGNGKTMLARAAATSLAKIHGATKAQGFIYVKGPALLSKWVGEAEAAVRQLFTSAREHKAKHGYPAIIFMDECDALLGSRDREHGHNVAVVPQFLAEMDGLEDTGALFVLATNRPDALDAAVVRYGRVDRKVHVRQPTQGDAKLILELHMRSRPVADADSVAFAVDQVYSPETKVREYSTHAGNVTVTLENVVSGALLAGLVETAGTSAMMRDIASGGKCTGITKADMSFAIKQVVAENHDLDHQEVVKDLLRNKPKRPTLVQKEI